jgi:alginate O-acetyltransferase complex protein AlgI
MVFTSAIFLFAFLPISLLVFYLAPPRWRTAPLLLTSAIFYAWGEPVLVVLILLTGLFTYWCGRQILAQPTDHRRKTLLVVGIVVSLIPIAVFKYLDFVLVALHLPGLADQTHLPLPIGVSFYTFMAISYLIDIYRRQDTGAPSLLAFSGFLTMFPHLVAGPIVRWNHIGPQLAAPRFDAGLFSYGALRVASGLAKKVVLADSLSVVVDGMFATGNPTSVAAAWTATALYSLQIYLDFSAYSDIAIGLAAMLGIRFHENFNYPYVARSAREFWQRWHISLGSWFRDYLYIPLGGSRVRSLLLWRNLMVVWALTGLWHGAAWTFVLWGVYFGVIIGLERSLYGDLMARAPRVLQHLYGLLIPVLGWVLFRSTSVQQAGSYYWSMSGLNRDLPGLDPQVLFALDRTWVIALIGVLLAAGVARPFMDRAESALTHSSPPLRTTAEAVLTPAAPPAVGQTTNPATGGRTATASGTDLAATSTLTLEPATAETVPKPISTMFAVVIALLVVFLLVVATAFIVATTYSPFIYFRF